MKKIRSPLPKKKVTNKTFGVPLEDLCKRLPSGDVEVPLVIKKVVEFIKKHGIGHEGLFRVNGNAKIIEKLKTQFDKNGDTNLEDASDVMSVASLLKQFVRELPDTVIPESLHFQFIDVHTRHHANKDELAVQIKLLLNELPSENYAVLKYLCNFLVSVSQYEDTNKMNCHALAICFGPNLFRCSPGFEGLREQGVTNEIVRSFLEDYDRLFQDGDRVSLTSVSSSSLNVTTGSGWTGPHVGSGSDQGSDGGIGRVIQVQEVKKKKKVAPPRPPPPRVTSSTNRSQLEPSSQVDTTPSYESVRQSLQGITSPIDDEDRSAVLSPFTLDSEGEGHPSNYPSPIVSTASSEVLEKAINETVAEKLFGSDTSSTSPIQSGIAPASAKQKSTAGLSPRERRRQRFLEMSKEEKKPLREDSLSGEDSISQQLSKGSLSKEEENVSPSIKYLIEKFSDNFEDIEEPDSQIKTSWGQSKNRSQDESGICFTQNLDAILKDKLEKTRQPSKFVEKQSNNLATGSKKPVVPPLDLDGLNTEEPIPAMHQHNLQDDDEVLLSPRSRSLLRDSIVPPDTDIPPSPPKTQSYLGQQGKIVDLTSDMHKVMKYLTKRIRAIKRKLEQYEDRFEAEYGYKPSHGDRASKPEIKKLMLELSKAKRQLKACHIELLNQQEAKEEATLAGQGMYHTLGSSTTAPINLNSLALDAKKEELTSRKTYLDSILKKLNEKRREANRPENLSDMTQEQIQEEKVVTQKVLLQFESMFGRPKRKEEREIMKPLYDRYRNIKKLISQFEENGVIEQDKDSNIVGSNSSKTELQPILENEAMDFPPSKTTNLSQSNAEDNVNTTAEFSVTKDLSLIKEFIRDDLDDDLESYEKLSEETSASSLHEISLSELLHKQAEAKASKKQLKKTLKDFEDDFFKTTGRKIQKDDRYPMEKEYKEYKVVKRELALVEALLAKHDRSKGKTI